MKSELVGIVKFDKRNTKRLDLENVSEIEMKLIVTMILGKSVTPYEATLISLVILVVVYVDSKPREMH